MESTRTFEEETASRRPEDAAPASTKQLSAEPETLHNITSSEETFKTAPVPAIEPCPRCGGRLINPESLGVCESCGFCRSLSATGLQLRPQPAPVQSRLWLLQLVQPAEWIGIVLGGLAAIGLVSAVAARCLPVDSPQLTIWSTLQFSAGILSFLTAQAWALVLVLPKDASLGFTDLLLPFRLWRRAARRLPETRGPISLALWGAALATCALAFLGHVSFRPSDYQRETAVKGPWHSFLPQPELREAAKNWDDDRDKSVWDSASANLDGRADLATKADEDGSNDTRPTVQCAILGFVPEADGTPATLVLGAAHDGQFRYAGLARHGFQDNYELLERLQPLMRRETSVRGANGLRAIWVTPAMFCEVQHSGQDEQGVLRDPRIKTLRR